MLTPKEKAGILALNGRELTIKLGKFFLEKRISKEKMLEALEFWQQNQKSDLYDEAIRVFGE